MVIIAGQRPGDGAYGWGSWLADVFLVYLKWRKDLIIMDAIYKSANTGEKVWLKK